MPETIEGYVLGQTVTMRVGDKVGLLWTGNDYSDTFAGQEVEIIEISYSGQIGVRTYNGICLIVGRLEVAPSLPKKHGGKRAGAGRKPIPRAPDERLIEKTITITESDIVYLLTLDPKNLSGAIRKLIAAHR